jgi:hypothetical protein
MAGSIMSSRLEAPMTMTFSSPSTPSISASSCGTIVVLDVAGHPEPRVRKSESISSKKTTTGVTLVGLLAGPLEDQPDVPLGLTDVLVEQFGALDVEEVALALRAAFASRRPSWPATLATALAISVLPHPGGP